MSSNLTTIGRIVRLGWTNFWRNRWLTLGATLLMTLTLTMISVSLLLTLLVRDTAEVVKQKIDLKIYFSDDTVPDEKISALADRVRNQDNVTSVSIISKAEALAIFSQSSDVDQSIKDPLSADYNPLPRTIQVVTDRAEEIPGVIEGLKAIDSDKIICDTCLSYLKNKEVLDNLISRTRFVQRLGLFLSLFFGAIAIFNVLNIIRITITARSDEIEIMRFVGASNAFVRGPFIIEGVLYGLFGTVFTTSLLLIGGQMAASHVQTEFSVLGGSLPDYLARNIWLLVGTQLAIGLGLGVVVSYLSIRRYLRS